MKTSIVVFFVVFLSTLLIKLEFAIVQLESVGQNRLFAHVKVPKMPFKSKKFLIDTGSTSTVVNESMLDELRLAGDVQYVTELIAYGVDNQMIIASMYRVSSIMVGECRIDNIEVLVLPSGDEQILGLDALQQVTPFLLSTSPPFLLVTRCKSA